MPFPFSQSGAGASGPQPPPSQASPKDPNTATAATATSTPGTFTDAQLLEMWTRWKRECFDQRWVFERQWMRNIWYILNRQWIYFDGRKGQWQDKRMAKWIPRPVTNILKDAVQAVRANFAAINYGTNARPLGEDNANVITAGVADDYAPILHEDHRMDAVMNEFDFWLLVLGNACLHSSVVYDRKNGVVNVQYETCTACGVESASDQIAEAGQKCPACGATAFTPAMNPDGSPKIEQRPLPKGVTMALSPLEIAFPLMYENFEQVPIVVRMRWRDKSYYEQTPDLQTYAKTLNFSKTPQERTMQLFKTLPFQNDLGVSSPFGTGGGSNGESEGIVEYDVWVKPNEDFPDGQVIRFAGDSDPIVIHTKQEALPGPLPYTDARGTPIFPFHWARYESVGGRALGSSLIDPAIQKQDQLNQLDSHMLMIIGRVANPVWLEPKGAEVEKFTGEPGLVVKWNPLVGGGNAKPERIPGEGINASVFQYREMIKAEAEELLGTNDLLKGQKPAGVEAFASLNMLVERSQAKHGSAYKERGTAYKGWFRDALEIERAFGPDERVKAVLAPTKEWAFDTFKKADLGGSIDIIIEDGTLSPKTSLGERAAIEHLRQLGLLNPSDPDQVMAIYQKFGQARLLPGLDAQVQEAWMNMDRFVKFLNGDPVVKQQVAQSTAIAQQQAQATGQPPMNVGPLQYKRWYNPQIHRQELVKWCLSDTGRDTFQKFQGSEMYVDAYLSQIDLALAQAQQGIIDSAGVPQQVPMGPGSMRPGPGGSPQAQGGQQPQPGGAGAAMANSNRNAAGAGPQSSGSAGAQQNGQQGDPRQIASQDRAISYLEHSGGR